MPPEKTPPQEKQPKGPSKIWELVKRKTKVEILHPDTPLPSEWSILAINKPVGILSQAGIPGEGTILDLLARDFPDLTNLKGVHRYPPARKSRKREVDWGGRLDKNTSGVMIFGKDDDTTTRLHDAFRDKRVRKSVFPPQNVVNGST
jgi:23S rRNA-/tRNA-specific pseudouridylate synthase